MKKALPNVYVLTAICLITAFLLALVNSFTLPVIREAEEKATQASLLTVLPDGGSFSAVEIGNINDSVQGATILAIYKASNGGYAVKVTTTGYSSGLQILFGINADGKIVGSKCLASSETLGFEKTYGENLVNADLNTLNGISTVSGATKTTTGYKKAALAALTAAEKQN